MPVSASLSAFGSANVVFFSGSRVCYAAAREGHMVRDGVWAHPGGLQEMHVEACPLCFLLPEAQRLA